jgi:hypothetical protein
VSSTWVILYLLIFRPQFLILSTQTVSIPYCGVFCSPSSIISFFFTSVSAFNTVGVTICYGRAGGGEKWSIQCRKSGGHSKPWYVKCAGHTATSNEGAADTVPRVIRLRIRRCIQKVPDWVDNEMIKNNNKDSLRSNTVGCGIKIH